MVQILLFGLDVLFFYLPSFHAYMFFPIWRIGVFNYFFSSYIVLYDSNVILWYITDRIQQPYLIAFDM